MIKKIFIGLGILLTAVLVGAGWYFSGLIYEIGFNVNNKENINAGTSEDIIFVEEIKEDSVVLNVQNERWGPLLENGIYGVIADNGFIIVNDIISSNDGIVERKVEYKEGSIEDGEGVSYALSLYERPDGNFVPVGATETSGQVSEGVFTPMSVSQMEYEEVFYESDFSTYPAYITGEGDEGWVIFIHGFRGDHRRQTFALLRAKELDEIGWKSMIIAYRNGDGMKQDPSGMYLYGATEWVDVDGAIDYAINNGAKKVVLFGIIGGGGLAGGSATVQAAFRADETSNQFVNEQLKKLNQIEEGAFRATTRRKKKQFQEAIDQTRNDLTYYLRKNRDNTDAVADAFEVDIATELAAVPPDAKSPCVSSMLASNPSDPAVEIGSVPDLTSFAVLATAFSAVCLKPER